MKPHGQPGHDACLKLLSVIVDDAGDAGLFTGDGWARLYDTLVGLVHRLAAQREMVKYTTKKVNGAKTNE